MNYTEKHIAITGLGNGFIADALVEMLKKSYHVAYNDEAVLVLPGKPALWVKVLHGDIRDPKTFEPLDYKDDYLFHFGAPSSQILFQRKPEFCVDSTINGFINASKACKEHGIKLVYPSTGLLSTGETNAYARCKKICEDLAPKDALGLRIFASYGPQEAHKRDYA